MTNKISAFANNLDALFEQSKGLESEIKENLKQLNYGG